jgi:hypothetical protein
MSVLDTMRQLPKVSPTSKLPALICQKLKDYLGFSDEDLADVTGRFQEFDLTEVDPEVWTSAEILLLGRARESAGKVLHRRVVYVGTCCLKLRLGLTRGNV